MLAWNLVGVTGLIGFAVGLGGVAGNWWVTVMVAGLFAVALSYIASTQLAADEPAPPGSRRRLCHPGRVR